MSALTIYLLKSYVSLGLFYLAYLLFMQRQNNFTINRAYLLVSVLFSFIIPEMELNFPWDTNNPLSRILLETITIGGEPIGQATATGYSLGAIIQVIYFAGLAFFLSRFIGRIGQLGLLVIRYGVTNYKGVKIVLTDNDIEPFSFFNLVFIAKTDMDNTFINEIIQHEKAHISQYHSFDIILIECVGIFQWFNPFIWLYKKSIQHIHEYQADQQVLRNGSDRFHYQQILFALTTGIPYNSIVNSFNQSLLKKRLIMMTKEKPPKWASFRMLITIPVAAILLMAFTSNSKGTPFSIINEINPEMVQDTIKKAAENEVFTVVDEMPVFSQGGEDGLKKYIATHVKYPEDSRKEGIQGKVYVSFVVDEQGKVVDVKETRTKAQKPNKDNKMVSCAAPELTAEAMRVVSSLPVFTPGKQSGKVVKVAYTIPINFLLDTDKKKETK